MAKPSQRGRRRAMCPGSRYSTMSTKKEARRPPFFDTWAGYPAPAIFLLVDLCHDAGADGTTAFTDRETQAFVHGDREAQRDIDLHVVARHHHLDAFRQLDRTGHVRGTEVELRAIVAEERRVTATLVLRQDVHLTLELGVRRDRLRLGQNLAALDVFTLQTADQHADVVTGLTLVEQLAEHFHARDRRGLGVLQANHFGRVTHLDDTALDATGQHRTATGDREHVFD